MRHVGLFAFCLLLIACDSHHTTEFMGCEWQLPSSFDLNADGTYFGELNGRSHVSVKFVENFSGSAALISDAYVNSGVEHRAPLTISSYLSRAGAPVEGVEVFVITREDKPDSAVVIFNGDMNWFFVGCNDGI